MMKETKEENKKNSYKLNIPKDYYYSKDFIPFTKKVICESKDEQELFSDDSTENVDKKEDQNVIIYLNKTLSNITTNQIPFDTNGQKIEIKIKYHSFFDSKEYIFDIYLAYTIKDYFENICSNMIGIKNFKLSNYVVYTKKRVLGKYRTFEEEGLTNGSVIYLTEKKYDSKLYPKYLQIIMDDKTTEKMGYNFNTSFEDLKSQIQNQVSTKRNKKVVPYFTNEDGSELYEFGEVISDFNFKDLEVIKYHDNFNKDDLFYKFRLIYEKYLKYNMTVIRIIRIKQLKHIISRLYKVDPDDFAILINDRFVTKEEDNNRLTEYNLQSNEEYEIMIFKTIGNVDSLYEVLKFNQDLREKQVLFSVDELFAESKKYFCEQLCKINNIADFLQDLKERYNSKYTPYLEAPLGLSIQLYTSDLMYRGINHQLKHGKYKECLTYLSYFQTAFLKLPLYIGRAYKGVSDKSSANHEKGQNILWMNISSLSKDYNVALVFSKDKVTQIPQVIYVLDVLSARYFDLLSIFSNEKEVTLFPYTILKVTDKKIDKKTGMITYFLTEVPTPKSPKILCWIDDKPKINTKYLEFIEMFGVSTVCLKSNSEVKEFFDHHLWLLSRRNRSTFKIITDMTRKENNVNKPKEGVATIKFIREQKYKSQILVFTSNKETAKEICIHEKLDKNSFICEDKDYGIFNYLNEGNFINSSIIEFIDWLNKQPKWDELRELNLTEFKKAKQSDKPEEKSGSGLCYIF